MENGAEMGPGGHFGAKGSQEGKKVPKIVWIWSGFEPFWAPFWDLEAFFSEYFFDVFLEVSFSLPGRLLGAKGAQKAPKMEPKWSPKGAWGYPLGSEKTMVFIVREAYGEVSGRLWEATFSRLRLQTLSGRVPGSILADFRRFWVPFGVPLGSIWDQKGSPKAGPKKGRNRHMLLGGAGGRGGVHLGLRI